MEDQKKRAQCRVTLAFRESDAKHMAAYDLIQSQPQKTDFVVDAILRTEERNKDAAREASEMLKEMVRGIVLEEHQQMVNDFVHAVMALLPPVLSNASLFQNSASNRAPQVFTNQSSDTSAAVIAPKHTPSAPQGEQLTQPNRDLSLAMKGLKLFGGNT